MPDNLADQAISVLRVVGVYTRLLAYLIYDHWNGAVLTLFNGLLLLFILGLWRSNRHLWQAARHQGKMLGAQSEMLGALVGLARDEFHAGHRPKVVLRSAVAPMPLNNDEGAGIVVYLTLSNVGATPAHIVESNVYVELMSVDDRVTLVDPSVRNDLLNGTIAPGESREIAFTPVNQTWDSKARHTYMPTGLGLFLVGHLAYLDEAERPVKRHSAFRRRYSPRDQRFHRVHKEENEHEYAD